MQKKIETSNTELRKYALLLAASEVLLIIIECFRGC